MNDETCPCCGLEVPEGVLHTAPKPVECWKFRFTETVYFVIMGRQCNVAVFSYDLHGCDNSRSEWGVTTTDGYHALASDTYQRLLGKFRAQFSVVADGNDPVECDADWHEAAS